MHHKALWPLTKASNRRWFTDRGDVRDDEEIVAAMRAFIERHAVKTIAIPQWLFWFSRDRWSGAVH